MYKWKVQLLGCSVKKWTTKDYEENEEKFVESELSVILSSNFLGRESHGWGGIEKLIFPELESYSLEERQKQFQQATLICKAFNEANI